MKELNPQKTFSYTNPPISLFENTTSLNIKTVSKAGTFTHIVFYFKADHKLQVVWPRQTYCAFEQLSLLCLIV